MKKVLRIGLVLVVIVGLAAAAFYFLRPDEFRASASDEEAPTTAVTRGSIEEIVSATGNVVADKQASLTFQTSGPIEEVLVGKGQEVEQGEVLARLDTSTLEWQVARSQASLETANARLEQAKKPATAEDLASAQAALDSAIAGRRFSTSCSEQRHRQL